jgi:hypothetical protein
MLRRQIGLWQRKNWYSAGVRALCAGLLFVPFWAQTAMADEIVLQNDSLLASGNAYVQQGFVAGDIAAAVFNPPCHYFPLTIKTIQVYWTSQSTIQPPVLTHIRVYGAGGPNPGSPLFTQEGVGMNAGYLNEFTVPGSGWVVNQAPFTVGIEYVGLVGDTITAQSGHISTDSNGCQQSKNLVFDAASSQWLSPCTLGMSGDFIIRVVVETAGGACYGDPDSDADVDLLDFAQFQRCISGSGPFLPNCGVWDCTGDGTVSVADLNSFGACLAGPAVSCVSGCATCQCAQLLASPLPPPGLRWTVTQVVVAVVVVAALVYLVGTCYSTSCRTTETATWLASAQRPTSAELARISQALSVLEQWGNEPDSRAYFAWVWYDTHYALDPFLTPIRIVHLPRTGAFNVWARFDNISNPHRVILHSDFVTGSCFDPNFLAVMLFAEQQHDGHPSETGLDGPMQQFKADHGVTLYPEYHHGLSEGEGVSP